MDDLLFGELMLDDGLDMDISLIYIGEFPIITYLSVLIGLLGRLAACLGAGKLELALGTGFLHGVVG